MGTPSFGKGSVQTIIPLPDNSAMRLTTARYYTPSGRSIQAKGIVPDIIVELAKVESLENTEGYKESDLKGALKNSEPASSEDDKAAEDLKDEHLDLTDDAKADYQLLRAIDLLRGVALYNSNQPVTLTQESDDKDTADENLSATE